MVTLKVASGLDMARAKAFANRLWARPHSLIALILTINNNSSALVSSHPATNLSEMPKLSVHHIFYDCDDDVLDALLGLLERYPKAEHSKRLRFYIDRKQNALHPPVTGELWQADAALATSSALTQRDIRKLNLNARGVVHDLHKIMGELCAEFHFFNGMESRLRVTWMAGVREVNRKRRGILFGSYDSRLFLVRVHPILDSKDVPDYFVRFVVYHEMLHALLDPPRRPGKRHIVHTQRFRMFERRYPLYTQGKEWEAEFVKSL